MVDEYCEVAQELLSIINDRSRPIPAKDVPKIVGRIVGGTEMFNCYPGAPGEDCHQRAFLYHSMTVGVMDVDT